MRPLVLLVLAESLVLALLASLYFGSASAAIRAAAPPGEAPRAPSPAEPAPLVTAPPRSPSPTAQERQLAPAAAPDVIPDDPVGILVTGSVLGTDGTPVEGASVYFRRDGEYRGGDGAAPGTYAAAGLLPGTWRVACSAEGYANFEGECTLDARAFQQFDITLKPSFLVRVKVLGADGKSIMDQLREASYFGTPYVVATAAPLSGDLPMTDNSRIGRFGLGEWHGYGDFDDKTDPKLLAAGYCGELRLNQPPPVYASLLLRTTLLRCERVEAGQHELVFTMAANDVLAKLGTVKLRLLDALSGEPLGKARVSISTAQGGGSHGQTGDDGRVVIEKVLPGLGCLDLFQSEREGVFRYVRVPAGGVVDLGDVRLGPPVQITGVVLGEDGKPATEASVQWTELDGRSFPQPLHYRRSAAVDADGKFVLPGCGRHRYVVSARLPNGGFGFATADASGGAPAPVTITLAPLTTVTLRTSFDATVGYVVTALAGDRSPVAVAMLGSSYRPGSLALPPGTYTIEITDMLDDRLVRSFALQVGGEPLNIDVP